ncbi:hypothetical protein FDI34_gp29 [Acinetobacter phage vB_ApiP_P2]|uniref:Uncharacterized protein n=1 Tax=Acinetobacter phage vB_ApiP_P2 TaxID=2016053 RepID=A0A221SC39_9CAUD|nr:hypothetical protein FDI34_gp29 [Acinetobacter phage vB_ApiP_P2]ASN73539.1 hypothetical protein P2_29 [Acinetobacter phage vB_ApiP_P2]
MSLNVEDSKRASGRTTRMILKAAEYLVKHPDECVTIVSHDRAAQHWMQCKVRGLLSEDLSRRVHYNYYRNALICIDINKPSVFMDHHCYYAEYVKAQHELNNILVKLSQWDE